VAPTPVLAAGGIGSGRQAAAALALGAQGVWTGSVWLTVKESDMIPLVKEKLLAAENKDTVRSRSFSGKPARLLRTPWTDAWDAEDSPGALPLPLQYMATADANARIMHFAESDKSRARELLGMPVGQVVGRMKEQKSSAAVIDQFLDEFAESVERLSAALRAAEAGD
jgi:NAD(P)H-dependent flavin oxidoreductase YrpB (nitropropane dioxygenase family)